MAAFFSISPLNRRRLRAFRANTRGFWSTWIFMILFLITLGAEFVANERPLLVWYDGGLYAPVLKDYPETTFGGMFETPTAYNDPFVVDAIKENGWILWPPIPYSFDTVIMDTGQAAPSPPSSQNLLGTDDYSRDVLATLIYAFRLSVLFGLMLTFASSIIGVAVGAVQGYFGGLTDLLGQRFLEIWTGLPQLFILIILSSFFVPTFWVLLLILMMFSWTALVNLVRAEVLRARNFDYVRAARALGVSDLTIVFRHILPNAMVATLTFAPFLVCGSVATLTALDFLGFGLPVTEPSIGHLLRSAKNNLHAPWLAITGFLTMVTMLTLLVFIGEAVRDAFNPRKGGGL